MNNKKNINDNNECYYDINNELIKHNDIVKIVRINKEIPYFDPHSILVVGKFYRIDSEETGMVCLVINKTDTLNPLLFLNHIDFEIQKK